MAEGYRRRAMRRPEVIEILENQGFVTASLSLPSGALRERQIWDQIEAQGLWVPCGNCREPVRFRSECIRDHKISLRRVEPEQRQEYDQAWNQWYLCNPCNSLKTHKRGLRGLGSDASQIAKLRRVEKGRGRTCKKSIPSQPFKPISTQQDDKPKEGKRSQWASSRPTTWPSRKIPSRPFPPRPKPADA